MWYHIDLRREAQQRQAIENLPLDDLLLPKKCVLVGTNQSRTKSREFASLESLSRMSYVVATLTEQASKRVRHTHTPVHLHIRECMYVCVYVCLYLRM